MSLTLIKPYFRKRLEGLSLREWEDGFASDNIPSTIVGNSFQHNLGDISGVSLENAGHKVRVEHFVEITLEAARDVKTSIDQAVSKGEDVLVDVCSVANYDPSILRVALLNMRVIPTDPDLNDNLVKIEMRFDVEVFICF